MLFLTVLSSRCMHGCSYVHVHDAAGASTSVVLNQVSSAADTCAQCTCATKAAAFLVRGNNNKSPCEVPEARAMTREVAYAMEEPNQCPAAVKGPVTAAMMAFCKKVLPRATILDAAAAKLQRGGGGFAGARVRDGGAGGSQPTTAAKAAGAAKPSPKPAAPSKPAAAGARSYAAAYAALLARAPIKPIPKQPMTACNPNGGRLCK